MSYDVYLTDPKTGTPLELLYPHFMHGGTYAMGGTKALWLNITYNYGIHFRQLGPKGIRELYGKTGAESLPILSNAIAGMKDNVHADYWEPTEGNARLALIDLQMMAMLRPDGVWNGD